MTGTCFTIEVQPSIPSKLNRLEELANNLLYSWDRQVRALFFRLDRKLWDETGHNPKLFLRRIDQGRLEAAAEDPVYMQDYHRVISTFDAYQNASMSKIAAGTMPDDESIISYSCAEFGLHESFPIYSGGLGILAGDHCKAASDLGLPFVAFGMLYRQGYFNQKIDGDGHQIVEYRPSDFDDFPLVPVLDDNGHQLEVSIDVPDRTIYIKLWMAQVGTIKLYLLDTDLEKNNANDRSITYQLYGGDNNNRMLQELVLGIGGVKAHRAIGINPKAWHINEGHAAFQILERCREFVEAGETFATALELVASSTVFTTHTPVPAGHDRFNHEIMTHYFSDFAQQLNIEMSELLALGANEDAAAEFNMTALALRGSRFHNGVSRIHGRVASIMESDIWPQIEPTENPIHYITNGVHVPTFLATEWATTFDLHFGGGWRSELASKEYWRKIYDIPSYSFWSVRQILKSKMLETVYERSVQQHRRNGVSESKIKRLTKYINPQKTDVLTVGFARRFATYKRATLIFSDPLRLKRLLDGESRPVVLIFAGKAHPHDQPGQELIRKIHEFSQHPDFEGKVVLLEDFDIALARKLVTGVDVWLNNPAYPLEASGTSGQKAGINGVLNLSVLDGWWDEGFNGINGWAITPHDERFSPEYRDQEESREILDTLEQEVIPCYYERDSHGYSIHWIDKCKAAMASLIPQFNALRMVKEYLENFYVPAMHQGEKMATGDRSAARDLVIWKQKVKKSWPKVTIERIDTPEHTIPRDQNLEAQVAVELNGLEPDDVAIDLLMDSKKGPGFNFDNFTLFDFKEFLPDGRALFQLSRPMVNSGMQRYKVRMYPYHALLTQRFEMGCMIWL